MYKRKKKMKFIVGVCVLFLLTSCFGPRVNTSDSLIVIDAGHGGHDGGATAEGKLEKELVLEISKKVYEAFKNKGYNVYLTRNSDKFLTLGQRTKVADKKDATVFISIHANAIGDKAHFSQVEGIETYFLQKTRDAKSQRVAARENKAVLKGADSLSKNVIIDSVLNGPKIIESNKLAIDVQKSMIKSIKNQYSDIKNGGVRPAPFYVLVGASRPSILVEVGYITNPKERERLFTSDYQERIADGIVKGTTRYIDNRKKEFGF